MWRKVKNTWKLVPVYREHICGLDNAILEKVFMNIKDVIEKLDLLFEED